MTLEKETQKGTKIPGSKGKRSKKHKLSSGPKHTQNHTPALQGFFFFPPFSEFEPRFDHLIMNKNSQKFPET